MPKTNTKRSTARTARKGFDRRKNKKGPRRPGDTGAKEKATGVIANSLFALTLKEKPGVAILDQLPGRRRGYHHNTDDYEQMYHDLFGCVKNYRKLKGEIVTFEPLSEGFDIGYALNYVINAFKSSILPNGWQFNVDRTGQGDYFFTIYDTASFPDFWHAFEVQPVVQYLAAKNKRLHDLFIQVIGTFVMRTGVDTWWNGGMGYAEYYLEEKIENWEDSDGDEPESLERKAKAMQDYENYKSGEAHKYERLITAVSPEPPEYFLHRLSRFDKKDPFVDWMHKACEFMMLPGEMRDFIYPEIHEEIGDDGLTWDRQVTVIWDWNDEYTHCEEESIDATVQGCGVFPPLVNRAVTRYMKEPIDFEELNQIRNWPYDLSQLWHGYGNLVEITKKKVKK